MPLALALGPTAGLEHKLDFRLHDNAVAEHCHKEPASLELQHNFHIDVSSPEQPCEHLCCHYLTSPGDLRTPSPQTQHPDGGRKYYVLSTKVTWSTRRGLLT